VAAGLAEDPGEHRARPVDDVRLTVEVWGRGDVPGHREHSLDPVERAVLLIALFELSTRPEVPYRVAINEAVALAKRFGATDGFKFVNAVLDRAARALRPDEH